MFLWILFSILLTILARVIYLVVKIRNSECKLVRDTNFRTIICIGSGGHTMEMLRINEAIDPDNFTPRFYVMANNDILSEPKIHAYEKERECTDYTVVKIPRSRNVKQSYITTVATTIYATLYAIPLIYEIKPDVIFCNGPGTCIPICIIAFLFRALFLLDCRIVFFESICRVETISISGKILEYFADDFIVQWPELLQVSKRAQYFGRLV